jgi:hypothetical protein
VLLHFAVSVKVSRVYGNVTASVVYDAQALPDGNLKREQVTASDSRLTRLPLLSQTDTACMQAHLGGSHTAAGLVELRSGAQLLAAGQGTTKQQLAGA